ncbi:MAG: hypothetical protein ABUS79_03170 [Pseudomonadota bacterium]
MKGEHKEVTQAEVRAPVKADVKAAGKADVKEEGKAAVKADTKEAGKVEGKPPGEEKGTAAQGAGKTAPVAVSAKGKAGGASAKDSKKVAGPRVGEGPSPANPPPLTIGGLREEARREGSAIQIDADAPALTKVEQMLAEISKTREAMREETARLEGMMNESGEGAGGGGGAPASAGGDAAAAGTGKPPKNPLDVLAKALRGIKPEQAAPIVARLDKRLAATVLLRMPPVDAGKIMGALKPETAAELATQIAMRAPVAEAKR